MADNHADAKSVDANLKRFAREAGKRAHDRGLDQRGAVTKQQGSFLVVEKQAGVEVRPTARGADRGKAPFETSEV